MVYVENKLKYAMTFKLERENGGIPEVFVFDCRRIYQDTGNIATTGVTPIAEDDFDRLYAESKVFKDHVDTGCLVKTKESGATTMATKVDSLEKENEILKAKLAEKTKAEALGEETEATDMKTQLEKTKKTKKAKAEKAEVDESEGF